MKNNIIRTVKYRRVSHDEQKLHGFSLQAQDEELNKFLAEHPEHKLVADVADEGISAVKIKKRDALQEILELARNKQIDLIIFTKLDRWFRSLDQYYAVQGVLEENNVAWMATSEDYETVTAGGRFKVNIMLSVAQQEREKTSERIIAVNISKVRNGQALSGGQNQGFAYTVKPDADGIKRVVKDVNTKDIVLDYINHFLTYQNKRQAYLYVKTKYNSDVSYATLSRVLLDTKIYGCYRDNPDYCEPYIDKATFDKIQQILGNNIKKSAANRIYLFSGMIICPNCGRLLSGKYGGGTKVHKRPTGKVYVYERDIYNYRCNLAYKDNVCSFRHQLNEAKIEKALLETMKKSVEAHLKHVKTNDARIKNLYDDNIITELKSEMTRLNNMYRKGRIKETEYDKEYDELEARLKEAESQLEPLSERDLSDYEELLEINWKAIYDTLTKENKRAFWRKYIQAIELDEKGNLKQPIFF